MTMSGGRPFARPMTMTRRHDESQPALTKTTPRPLHPAPPAPISTAILEQNVNMSRMTKQIIDQATPQTMPPYSRDAIFEPDGPLDPRCMEQAICTIIRNTPVDLDEPRSHTSRRTFCAMRALAALHPRDEIEIMLGVQAVCAYHAAADCWRPGANPRRDEDKTRHISKAATAVRTFETALRALERRQAKPLSVPAGRPASRVWDPVDADAVVQALRDRCEIGVDPATRMPTSAEAEHMTDDEIVSTWARHNRFADEHAGLDLANTESILPGGGMIVPEDPTPQQAAYLARRLMLSYVRLQDENRRNGITEKIKVRPLHPGDLVT
jgi:hypothetical protein